MTKVTATTVPGDSALRPSLADADYYDAYEAPLNTAALSPTEIFLRASRNTPRWVDDLMAIRNRIVRLFGLKDVGAMKVATRAPDSYQVGDRLGIFSIFGKETLLGKSVGVAAKPVSSRQKRPIHFLGPMLGR